MCVRGLGDDEPVEDVLAGGLATGALTSGHPSATDFHRCVLLDIADSSPSRTCSANG
jgi:hypothetical protein